MFIHVIFSIHSLLIGLLWIWWILYTPFWAFCFQYSVSLVFCHSDHNISWCFSYLAYFHRTLWASWISLPELLNYGKFLSVISLTSCFFRELAFLCIREYGILNYSSGHHAIVLWHAIHLLLIFSIFCYFLGFSYISYSNSSYLLQLPFSAAHTFY